MSKGSRLHKEVCKAENRKCLKGEDVHPRRTMTLAYYKSLKRYDKRLFTRKALQYIKTSLEELDDGKGVKM